MMNFYFLFRLIFLTVFMISITQWKHSVQKLFISLSLVIILIWIVNSAIYKFTNIDFSNTVYPFTVSIPVLFCFLLLSSSSPLKVVFSFLTVCNFGMMTSFVGLLSYYLTQSFTMRVIFEFISFIIIFVLVIKFFRKAYFRILNTLNKGWVFFCLFPLLLCTIIYLLLYYPTEFINRPESMPVISLVFALTFVLYITFYKNFENISELFQYKHDREAVLLQTEMEKKEYDAIIDKINAMKVYRHDMRHHITAVHTFLNDDNIFEAKNYLNKLNNNLSNTIVKKYCENYMVNVFLSSYISKACDEQIDVECKADISNNIKIDNMELGLIFTNAIENAIIACKKIENPSERKITIVCKEHFDQIYIQITNPFAGTVQFDGEFPVSSERDHGIGTRSIATIVSKYDGVYSFTAEDGIFKTTAILNNISIHRNNA